MADKPMWGNDLEAWATPILQAQDVPGLALGAAQGGRSTYFWGYGHRDRERQLPVTPRTVFGIGSITKSFTAVAIMQLQEAGRLSVDDPVGKHVPELRLPNVDGPHAMRIEHLLAHSAGLPPLPTLRACLTSALLADPDVKDEARAKLGEPVDTYDQMVAYLNRLEITPIGLPGENFSYSNDAWALLGLIVQRTSGEAYEAYVRDHILVPAGMADSRFDMSSVVDGPDTTRLYNQKKEDDGTRRAYDAGPWWDTTAMCAAGFLRSSVADMLRYTQIYRTGGMVGERRILGADSVRAMTRPRVPCDLRMWYGFGLMVTPEYEGGVHLVEHGGNIKGAAAWMTIVPERELAVVGLSNLSGAPTGRITLAAVNAALGLGPARPRVVGADGFAPAAPLTDYAGRFASDEDANYVFDVGEDGQLAVTAAGERRAVRPLAADAFVVETNGNVGHLQFVRDADGRVSALRAGFRFVRRVPDEGEAAG